MPRRDPWRLHPKLPLRMLSRPDASLQLCLAPGCLLFLGCVLSLVCLSRAAVVVVCFLSSCWHAHAPAKSFLCPVLPGPVRPRPLRPRPAMLCSILLLNRSIGLVFTPPARAPTPCPGISTAPSRAVLIVHLLSSVTYCTVHKSWEKL